MVGPRESIVLEFSNYPEETVELFNELVNRHDHLREAVELRTLAKQRAAITKVFYDRSALERISESVLWFFAVEFYSRFLSDPTKKNHSKRCLLTLIREVDETAQTSLEIQFEKFKESQRELLSYLHIQRMKFFAHADEVSWEEFPNLTEHEYIRLLNSVADILDSTAPIMNLRRVCTRVQGQVKIFEQTKATPK